MKKLSLFLGFALLLLAGCKTNENLGEKVNEPFTGNKYESNDRYFRGTGKGQSMDENISRNKADLQAKKVLAQQVETNVKVVTDQYLKQPDLINLFYQHAQQILTHLKLKVVADNLQPGPQVQYLD